MLLRMRCDPFCPFIDQIKQLLIRAVHAPPAGIGLIKPEPVRIGHKDLVVTCEQELGEVLDLVTPLSYGIACLPDPLQVDEI